MGDSKLRRYIEEHGVSAYRLQKETGLSFNTIYRLMRNDNVGTIDTWSRISDALGCTIDEILGYGDEDGR